MDALVAGKLDDVSDLENMSLARGADRIAPSTRRAMRRMVAEPD